MKGSSLEAAILQRWQMCLFSINTKDFADQYNKCYKLYSLTGRISGSVIYVLEETFLTIPPALYEQDIRL